ncbi:hypothetical protein C9374_011406 [Naegleria lovaniensis]|uniref:Phosphatidylinositol-specific phospholipase C X domain-containing protein n=1 Tax=Naegleria lovaniensis TaxID=51637 RepID=A0AA88H4F9_NAELO|nr:uncharacterized protein C9374_011406 [Naegleria lovaniensis]KAG2392681.1 hypothetical protein C9374_011406 [Naegleria lovaniensis]
MTPRRPLHRPHIRTWPLTITTTAFACMFIVFSILEITNSLVHSFELLKVQHHHHHSPQQHHFEKSFHHDDNDEPLHLVMNQDFTPSFLRNLDSIEIPENIQRKLSHRDLKSLLQENDVPIASSLFSQDRHSIRSLIHHENVNIFSFDFLNCQTPLNNDLILNVQTPTLMVRMVNSQSWMKELSQEIGEIPMSQLKIPATHNSASYNVSSNQEYGVDVNYDSSMSLIPQMAKLFKMYGVNPMRIKQFVAPWFKNQECSILQQLKHGIRHLDLRLCKVENSETRNNKFWACHGLLSVTFSSIFEQVKQFHLENPFEVITLDINHIYGFTSQKDHLEFLNMTSEILGIDSVIDPSKFSTNSTLNSIWKESSSSRIFLFYNHQETTRKYASTYKLFPSSSLSTPWANKQQMPALYSEILTQLRARSNLHRRFVSQILLTPNLSMMVDGLFEKPKSVRQLAEMNYGSIPEWIKDNAPGSKLNVVNTDYYNLNGRKFITQIISQNFS